MNENITLYNKEIIEFLIKEGKTHEFMREYILYKTRNDIDKYEITFDEEEIKKDIEKFELDDVIENLEDPTIFEGIPKDSNDNEKVIFVIEEICKTNKYRIFRSGKFICTENPNEHIELCMIYV